MTIPRWSPPIDISSVEAKILKLVKRHRKLFGFLRQYRHELFNNEFQAELETMYRDTGAGETPKPPALMCMALLLQAYVKASDVEAVVASQADARWKLALDSVDSNEPLFSQGCLQQFRERLIAHDMDKRLLERTVELARQHKGFDWRKLPKRLKVGIDSRPLVGAGRVEDTFNLLGHAARKLLASAAKKTGVSRENICSEAGCALFLASSVKAGLDIDWSDAEQKNDAINRLVDHVCSLTTWVEENIDKRSPDDPIQRYLDALEEFEEQDLERDSDGTVKIRNEVAKDRRISVEDPEMRHGRKSKKKTFNGYKEHVATDLTMQLILACAVTPANVPEQTAAATLTGEICDQGFEIEELLIDRGYISSSAMDEVEKAGGEILCKPWRQSNNKTGLFTKAEFDINIRDKTITCPGGQVEAFDFGKTVEFNPRACAQCPLRNDCTTQSLGRGRTIRIAEDEARQKRLRRQQATKKGRKRLRERTEVEHRLAHLSSRKGPRARYLGVRKNEYDLRRASALQNLEAIQRKAAA